MSIDTTLDFDAQKLRFDKFVYYGGDGVKITEQGNQKSDKLANHDSFYIFRPYRIPWIQLVTVFAAHGAVSGDLLFDILIKLIVTLH